VKRIVLFVAVGLYLSCHVPAFGQVFYAFPNAPVVGSRELATGSYAAVGENELFRLGGYGRLSVAKYLDAGVEVLLDVQDGDVMGGAVLDVKLAAFPSTKAIPVDLSLNTGVGFVGDSDFTLIQVPVGAIISSPFKLDSGKVLVPYLGVYLLIVDIDRDLAPPRADISDTDLDAELRGGVRYELEGRLDLFGTLHIGREALFALGVNFKL
jgi:hypothetical protein